jgi:hypothetical protein
MTKYLILAQAVIPQEVETFANEITLVTDYVAPIGLGLLGLFYGLKFVKKVLQGMVDDGRISYPGEKTEAVRETPMYPTSVEGITWNGVRSSERVATGSWKEGSDGYVKYHPGKDRK